MKLRIYHYEKDVKVLGKGNRFVLWVQGCKKRCFNCIATDSWDLNGGIEIDIEELVKEVKDVDGITITGGEPFLQADKLSYFLDCIDKNLDVIIYSGYKYEEIIKDKNKLKLLKKADLLIDGEYIDELNFDNPLVGSLNQNIYVLSERGKELAKHIQTLKSREIEIRVRNNEVFVVGVIPKKLKGVI